MHSSPADYRKSQAFFFFGLFGESSINVKAICRKKSVKQMRSQTSFLDGLLAVVTLGIYTPRTASVWCDRSGEEV